MGNNLPCIWKTDNIIFQITFPTIKRWNCKSKGFKYLRAFHTFRVVLPFIVCIQAIVSFTEPSIFSIKTGGNFLSANYECTLNEYLKPVEMFKIKIYDNMMIYG